MLLPEFGFVRDRREGVRLEHEAEERDARVHVLSLAGGG
jgi:hypothetical protein